MHRRNLFKKLGVVVLYGSFPSVLSEFLVSCNANEKILRAEFFSDGEFQLLNQVVDIILPRTSTPGAIDVNAPYFIELVVRDCMSAADQQMIRKGLLSLEHAEGKNFLSLNADEQKRVVTDIDKNAFNDENSNSWFRILKKLVLIGFFTSREGMTTALNYVQVPGEYKGSIPYKKGDKAMAKTFLMYW
jgi:hypothetical protein